MNQLIINRIYYDLIYRFTPNIRELCSVQMAENEIEMVVSAVKAVIVIYLGSLKRNFLIIYVV
jgi:hypothetical protein